MNKKLKAILICVLVFALSIAIVVNLEVSNSIAPIICAAVTYLAWVIVMRVGKDKRTEKIDEQQSDIPVFGDGGNENVKNEEEIENSSPKITKKVGISVSAIILLVIVVGYNVFRIYIEKRTEDMIDEVMPKYVEEKYGIETKDGEDWREVYYNQKYEDKQTGSPSVKHRYIDFESKKGSFVFSYPDYFKSDAISERAPHLVLKLNYSDNISLTIGIWDEYIYHDNIWNSMYVDESIKSDKEFSIEHPDNVFGKKIKLRLPKEINVLKSNMFIGNGLVTMRAINYKFIHKQKLITVNVFINTSMYEQNKNIPDELIKGLKLI